MPADELMRRWISEIDALAEQANAQMELAVRQQKQAGEPGPVVADSLLAIAAQLAYGNAVAAAAFHMSNRLIIMPAEGGDQ